MSYKVEAWPWCADYCKKNKHSPYDSYFWDKAMLEYRREHNIFEVGDKVVLVDLRCSNDIWCVSESSTSDYVGVIKEGMLGFSVMHKSMIRHATDAEIAAWHRL